MRKVRLALLAALPGAITTLTAISEGPACEGDIEAGMDASDVPLVDPALAPHEQERVQRAVMHAIAAARVPNPKNLEQKRIAALGLVDLAQTLDVFSLAREFRAPDIEADEEAEIARLARKQGIDLSGYTEKPERLLRTIK